ncbi:MAG: hypothetical protein PHN75_14670 [Syntrophales bacterium]|nr:hypothetical protein [Syntrophales bacterium]
MMNPMNQWLSFQKTILDNSFQSMTDLQQNMVKQVIACIELNPFLPAEGKRLIAEWVDTYRKGCESLKSSVDANYRKVEAYFSKGAE